MERIAARLKLNLDDIIQIDKLDNIPESEGIIVNFNLILLLIFIFI